MPKKMMDMFAAINRHELSPEEERRAAATEQAWGADSSGALFPTTRAFNERALKSGDASEEVKNKAIFDLDEEDRRLRSDPNETRNHYTGKGKTND